MKKYKEKAFYKRLDTGETLFFIADCHQKLIDENVKSFLFYNYEIKQYLTLNEQYDFELLSEEEQDILKTKHKPNFP